METALVIIDKFNRSEAKVVIYENKESAINAMKKWYLDEINKTEFCDVHKCKISDDFAVVDEIVKIREARIATDVEHR